MREKTKKSLLCWWALLLVLMFLPSVVMAQTVIMFKSPYPSGKTMTVRDANVSTAAVTGMPGWQSYTFAADPYGPGSREWFFQPGSDNECYDLDGMTTSDQNCGNKFSAALSWPTDTMWIIPDITTAKRAPILSEQRPRRLYFLNPEEWVTGVPEVIISGTSHRMLPDSDRCGWFYLDLFVEDGPFNETKQIYFRFDQDTTQVAGAGGLQDLTIDANIAYVNLEQQFSQLGNAVFFEPLDFLWASTDMEMTGICGYNLAALIRDFHHSTHPNFYLPNDDPPYFNYSSFTGNDLTGSWDGNTYSYTGTPFPHYRSTGTKNPCEGITPGIVENRLNRTTRKPTYVPSSGCFGDPAGAADGTEWFDWLFKTDQEGKINQEHCYDLPFKKAKDGLWVYDSQDEPDAGFFPMDWLPLNANANSPFNIPAPAQCSPPLKADCVPYFDTLSPSQVEAGPASVGCAEGGTADDWWNWGGRSCTMNDFWTGGYSGSGHEDYAPRNQHFCFEIHAEFIYSPGQTFTFRGNDDFWVFIDDTLVVDNGGVHLPAPGYVELDDISSLAAGNTYPIDIFFCDRQPLSSNLYIKTSVYFQQPKAIFYEVQGDTYEISKLEGGTGNCASLQNPGGQTLIPGDQIANLTYKLMDTRGNTIDLPTSPGGILPVGEVSFGGIDLTVSGQVTIKEDDVSGLEPGRYRLVITDGTATEYITIRVADTEEEVVNLFSDQATKSAMIILEPELTFVAAPGNLTLLQIRESSAWIHHVSIYDMNGASVYQSAGNSSGTNFFQSDPLSFSPGVYFLKIHYLDGRVLNRSFTR